MIVRSQNKFEFSGDPNEKAYLIGLRTGDIHARKHYRLIHAETTSTKQAQLLMFKKAFGRYARVKTYEKKGGYTEKTNRIYCFLDSSFEFLVKKPESIPKWILSNEGSFLSFLTGYCDSEGSWIITQHKKYNGKWKDLTFSLGTCDKTVLEQIHQKLIELGFNSHIYMVRKKGVYGTRVCNYDLYRVMMSSHKDVVKLAKVLLPLSMHEDKQRAKLRIIDYNKENIKKKLLKRKLLGTVELPCPKCDHKKTWKDGFSRSRDRKYQRYKCPACRLEFHKSTAARMRKEKIV